MTFKKYLTLVIFVALLLLWLGCSAIGKNSVASKNETTLKINSATEIDGVYAVVSDVLTIEDGETRNEIKSPKEWSGLWIFSNAYFSGTLMKIERPDWTPSHFPTSPNELGFESFAGPYSLHDGKIALQLSQSLYPGRVNEREVFSYTVNGPLLTLSQETGPSREYSGHSRWVITLKKQ